MGLWKESLLLTLFLLAWSGLMTALQHMDWIQPTGGPKTWGLMLFFSLLILGWLYREHTRPPDST